jgi:superfamily II DNA/RNA helicase
MGEAFARGLALDGITTPTAIQVAAIPAILAGKHVVVQSGTGTGKTLAYLLPALQRLSKQPHAKLVVFAPAAELAIQTLRTLERYAPADLSSASLVAGGNIKAQKGRLQKSTRAIVGTPGRILDMVAERRLKGVTMVVLDEPEPILTGKDARFLVEVLSRPPRVQLILAAATLGPQSERLIAELMAENLVRANVADDPLAERIAHYFVSVRHAGAKDVRLARFLETNACQRAIVFANEGPTLRHLFRYLSEQGLSPVTVSQERAKLSCQQALAAFAKAEARVLLTTDTAATGLDIPEVDWVFHYELPHSAKAYRHRAGRTGRAGRAGSSVAIVTENEVPLLERYERELGIEFRRFGTRE